MGVDRFHQRGLAFRFRPYVFDEALIAKAVVGGGLVAAVEHFQIALTPIVALKFLNVEHALCCRRLVLRFAIKVSLLERQNPARLLPGGSKNDVSKESSRGAPGGGMSSALILRRAPTLSPTCERGCQRPGDGWTREIPIR